MKGIHCIALAAFLVHAQGQANEADIALGQQWARCAQKAKIFSKASKGAEEAKKWKEIAAVHFIYAEAAMGSEAVQTEMLKTEADFAVSSALTNKGTATAYLSSYSKQAAADIDARVVSLGQHGSRFGTKVDQLLKEFKARASRPN
jgi:mannitol-specific phosphotransferase system IIBC component